MKTVKVLCACESKFQDKEYGQNIRLANVKAGPGSREAVCTVCGAVHIYVRRDQIKNSLK